MTVPHSPHSYHIFLFPFCSKSTIIPELVDSNWELEVFDWKNKEEQYNQHRYFHNFAENVMFGCVDKKLLKNLDYKIEKDSTFKIDIEKNSKQYSYTLLIENVKLNIYNEFKIGVLAFYLANYETDDFQDILRINDYGRRIYPAYLPLKEAQKKFLAKQITLTLQGIASIVEDYLDPQKQNHSFKDIPNFISHFIGKDITPAIDDRMFVCSFYKNFSLANSLGEFDPILEKYAFQDSDDWYEYIFIDNGGATCKSKLMKPKLLLEATNDRWVEYGTLHGISRYSFVTLTNGFELPMTHLKNLYAEMSILCLAQRSCILSFSKEVTNIYTKDTLNAEGVSDLYRRYIDFRNRLFFREITPQEQGIELFELLQKQMRLDEEMKDLDEQIAELNQFIGNKEQATLTEAVSIYSPVAIIISILAIVGLDKLNQLLEFNSVTFDLNTKMPISTLAIFILYIIIIIISIFVAKPLLDLARKLAKQFK